MFSILKTIITYLFYRKGKPQQQMDDNYGLTLTEVESYKLFDWVMLNWRYDEVQECIRRNINHQFNPLFDVGVILGTSNDYDGGIPKYYVTGWYNLENPEHPLIKHLRHEEIIQIVTPSDSLSERGLHLDAMYQAFFTNWLDQFNHDRAIKN